MIFRRYWAIALLIFFTLPGKAQNDELTLEQTFAVSQVTFFLALVIMSQPAVNSAATGQGQTWDHSDLSQTGEFIASLLEADDPNVDDYFPETNQIWKTEVQGAGIETKSYIKAETNGITQLGRTSDSSGKESVVGFSDEKTLYELPAGYQDSWSDKFAINIEVNVDGFQETQEGMRTCAVDGTGSLILPVGEFGSVLRIRCMESGTFQSYFNGSPIGTPTEFERVIYEFWRPDVPQPLATFMENSYLGQTFYEVTYMTGDPLRTLDSSPEEIVIYPNPASNRLYIKLERPFTGKVEIIDNSGRTFLTPRIKSADELGTIGLNVSNLSPGIYTLRFRETDQISEQKFIVQR